MSDVSRRDFLKKAAPVIAAVGLAGALKIEPAFAANPSTQPPTPGNRVSTASYIIFYDKQFNAQNGVTGTNDYSGPDAATVVQSAINSLPKGGLIVLKRGLYPMSNCIKVNQGINVLGEQGAVLQVAAGSQTAVNAFNIIEISGDNVTIDNLELDGNASGNPNLAGTTADSPPANPNMQSAIVGRSGQNILVKNCIVHDTWNAGIWLAAIDGNVTCAEIASCQIERTGRSFNDPSSTNPPQSANAVYVFGLSGSTSGSNIHDNDIDDTMGRGIYLHFDTDTIVSNNILTKTPEPLIETAGIVVDDGAERITLRGNQVSGYGPGILVVWAGCENIIIDSNCCIGAPNSGGSGSGIVVGTSTASGLAQRNVIIKGNICEGNALPGISVSASETIIMGNICSNNNVDSGDSATRRAGILLQSGQSAIISNVSIIGNRCFDDQGTPTQQYGVSISQLPNRINDVLVSNNDLRGNAQGGIGMLDCFGCRVTGNLGYNPLGLSSVNVQSSPFTYTNQDGVPEAIYIAGGSVSEISKNGTLIFASSPATVWLEPGESITIVHSDPPQMLKDQH